MPVLDLQFVTWQRFEADILRLWQILPRPFRGVIGCPRSGMYAAAKIALLESVPLWTCSTDKHPSVLGRGARIREAPINAERAGSLILIEDSINTGKSLAAHRCQCPDDTLSAVVYQNPRAAYKADIRAWTLPMPHFFEWHLANSALAKFTCFDMDGTICEDCPPECDDDGPRYAKWMAAVRPRMLPRLYPAAAIVTARLEKYRPQTEAWLQRYGVQYSRLVMGPWPDLAARKRAYDPRVFKAGAWNQTPGDKLLFVESCPVQARMIHEGTGRAVACNTTGKLWVPDH